jgi:hypothetical protein
MLIFSNFYLCTIVSHIIFICSDPSVTTFHFKRNKEKRMKQTTYYYAGLLLCSLIRQISLLKKNSSSARVNGDIRH